MEYICTSETSIKEHLPAKGYNRINVFYNSQLYFNKMGVFNDGHYPDVISTKNTWGYVMGLEYERITKKGFIVDVGFQYGRQKHDVTVTYSSLDFFDTINQEGLSKLHGSKNYGGNINYIGLRLMAGYRWMLPPSFLKGSWRLDAKAGINIRMPITEADNSMAWRIAYDRTDSTLYFTYFGNDVAVFGGKPRLSSPAWSKNAEVYLGMNKAVKWGIIQDLSLGITATYGIGGKYKGVGDVSAITFKFPREVISEDEYRTQDFSIGLKLSVGLWPH